MNRRKLLALSSLALTACGKSEEQNAAKSDSKQPAAQNFDFAAKFKLPLAKRPVTSKETFAEAHVAGILLTALHGSALTSLKSSATPTGELQNADPTVYKSVHDFVVANPNVVEGIVGQFRQAVAHLSTQAAGSGDDPYNGDPESCLTAGNLQIVQGLFKVKPS